MTTGAIPLADVGPLARVAVRTRLVRLALAVGALAAATAAFAFALREPPPAGALLPPGSDGIVVLDMSASVSAGVSRRLAGTLDRLARSKGRYGLVLFSDTAYVALPPGSPAAELSSFARFSRVPARGPGALPAARETPWSRQFSAGTVISMGLVLALELARESRGGTSVVLVSDLDDSGSDTAALRAVLLEYRDAEVPLRVVGLDPAPEDRVVFDALTRPGAVTLAPDPAFAAVADTRARDSGLIVAAILAGVLLAGLLAVTARLRWRHDG